MKIFSLLALSFMTFGSLFAKEGKASSRLHPKPQSEIVIVGGGMTGALEAYYAYTDAVKNGTLIQITIYEKGSVLDMPLPTSLYDSTMPQNSELTPDAVASHDSDPLLEDRTQALFKLRKMGTAAWQLLYDEAAPELQAIFQQANYPATKQLHEGDQIDLVYEAPACLDVRTFLPKFYEYMKKKMGTYVAKGGEEKPCFDLQFNKEVSGVRLSKGANPRITSLKFTDGSSTHRAGSKRKRSYVFCPDEAVGTLSTLGFDEPLYDGFPTLGRLYAKGRLLANARCTAYLGSGGVAFAPAAVQVSRKCYEEGKDPLIEKLLTYADSRRTPSEAL